MSIRIYPVGSASTPEGRAFVEIPFSLYEGCRYHVPMFRREMRKILNRKHSFFDHSEGDFFVAYRNGNPVGRIAVLEPKRYNSYQRKLDGRFYFFESARDINVSQALLDRAEQWGKDRGLARLTGPQGFTTFTGVGILIDGFRQTASMTMTNYNYPYYQDLLEEAGFEKYKDFYSADLAAENFTMNEKIRRAYDLTIKRGGFSVPSVTTKKEFRALGREIGNLYNATWQEHEEFNPYTRRELKEMIDNLSFVSNPSLIKVIRKNRELAGFALTFPDLSQALIRSRGRMTPLTIIDILKEKKRTRRFLINGLGILPKYQKLGGTSLLFMEVERILREQGVETAEMTQIAETTDLMLKAMERLGGRIHKTHRVYQKKL